MTFIFPDDANIWLTNETDNTLELSIDPMLFNDFDAADNDERYNVEINFADADFDCESHNCDAQTLPSISFLDMAPVQSIETHCLAHYPAVLELIKAAQQS